MMQNDRSKIQEPPGTGTARLGGNALSAPVLLILFCLASLLTTNASAQGSKAPREADVTRTCKAPGYSIDCNGLGTLVMRNEHAAEGAPAELTATLVLNETLVDEGARWILLSLRHVPPQGTSSVSIGLSAFESTSRTITPDAIGGSSASEIKLWVDAADAPVRERIEARFLITAGEPGTYTVEALAMPFRSDYGTIETTDGPTHLFTTTQLTVAGTTGPVATRDPTPAFEAPLTLAAIGGLAAGTLRRRHAR